MKDWITRARPSWREIVAAFVHAGRGLAAAHDAGLVRLGAAQVARPLHVIARPIGMTPPDIALLFLLPRVTRP